MFLRDVPNLYYLDGKFQIVTLYINETERYEIIIIAVSV